MSRTSLVLPSTSEINDLVPSIFPKMESKVTQRTQPKYLQPRNITQHIGKHLRQGLHVFESPHAGFGARIACAVLCSQIPAFLHQTQSWYTVHRVIFASITIATCTTRSLGQSVFGVTVCIIPKRWVYTLEIFADRLIHG